MASAERLKIRKNKKPGSYDRQVYFGYYRYCSITFKKMKKIKAGPNFAVFVLFFGIAALEAFQTAKWSMVLFWLAIGLIFLLADNVGKKRML